MKETKILTESPIYHAMRAAEKVCNEPTEKGFGQWELKNILQTSHDGVNPDFNMIFERKIKP